MNRPVVLAIAAGLALAGCTTQSSVGGPGTSPPVTVPPEQLSQAVATLPQDNPDERFGVVVQAPANDSDLLWRLQTRQGSAVIQATSDSGNSDNFQDSAWWRTSFQIGDSIGWKTKGNDDKVRSNEIRRVNG